jgi:hypothetical protein
MVLVMRFLIGVMDRGRGGDGTHHVVASGLVDGEVGDADHGDEDQRCEPVHLRRAERSPGESEEADGFEEDEPQESDHAALGLDAVLAARELHLLAVMLEHIS